MSIPSGCGHRRKVGTGVVPKRSADYMARRRDDILGALFACVRRRGWDRTTMDDVAAEAGLSKGAVYVHFESKRTQAM